MGKCEKREAWRGWEEEEVGWNGSKEGRKETREIGSGSLSEVGRASQSISSSAVVGTDTVLASGESSKATSSPFWKGTTGGGKARKEGG